MTNFNLLKNFYRQIISQNFFFSSQEFQYILKFFLRLRHKSKTKRLLNLKVFYSCLLKKHQQIFQLFLDYSYTEFFEMGKGTLEKQEQTELVKFSEKFTYFNSKLQNFSWKTFILNFKKLFFLETKNQQFFKNFPCFSFIQKYKQTNFFQQKNFRERKDQISKYQNNNSRNENFVKNFDSLIYSYLLTLKQQLNIFKRNSFDQRSLNYISLIFLNKSWKFESIYKTVFLAMFNFFRSQYQNSGLKLKLKTIKSNSNFTQKNSKWRICFFKIIIRRITLVLKSKFLNFSTELNCCIDLNHKSQPSLCYENFKNSKKNTFFELLFPEFKFFDALTILFFETKKLNFKSQLFPNNFQEFLEKKILSNFCFALLKKYEFFNLLNRNFYFITTENRLIKNTKKSINYFNDQLNFFKLNYLKNFIKVHKNKTKLKFRFIYANFLQKFSIISLIYKQHRKTDRFLIDFTRVFEKSLIRTLHFKNVLKIDLSKMFSSKIMYAKKNLSNFKIFVNQKSNENSSKTQRIFSSVRIYSTNLSLNIYSNYTYEIRYNSFKIKNYLLNLKKLIKLNSAQKQEILIKRLSAKLYTWCYYQMNFPVNYKSFYLCDNKLYELLWKWACRRHNNKSKYWIQSKYFYKLNNKVWLFGNLIQDSEIFYHSMLSSNKLIYLPFHLEIVNKLKGASPKLRISELNV